MNPELNETRIQAAASIRKQQQQYAEIIVRRQYALQSRIWEPYGTPGMEKSLRDMGYHLTYLIESLAAGDPILFTEYLAWVKVLFAGLKFGDEVLTTTLEITREVLSENLPADQASIAVHFIDQGLRSLQTAPTELESFIHSAGPRSDLASQYLNALLQGDRRTASAVILQEVQSGTPIKEIYLRVFQPTLREIGRLWQTNQISVAHEHFFTASTQVIMSQLYPYILTGGRKNRSVVVCCVSGELHEIGARMVADFFEMEGWDSHFLGANTPIPSIVKIVEERRADILALSATMTFHVKEVAEIITAVHKNSPMQVKILVGGNPFNLSQGLWRAVGADGYASDAQTAIVEAERLLSS